MPILKNSRHEKFAQLVASGRSDLQAYMEALGTCYATAQKNAHRLKENEGVAARIKELQSRSEEKADITRGEVVQILGKIAKIDLDEIPSYDAKLKAIALLTKMCGWDAPDKVELSADNELSELLKRLRGGGNKGSS